MTILIGFEQCTQPHGQRVLFTPQELTVSQTAPTPQLDGAVQVMEPPIKVANVTKIYLHLSGTKSRYLKWAKLNHLQRKNPVEKFYLRKVLLNFKIRSYELVNDNGAS